jgi:hypothetical protein
MSLAASRAVLRQSTFAVRRAGLRNASTTSEATAAVKDKAAQASSKASEGLTKVSSSASSAASKVGDAASATKAQAGGMMGTVQGQYSGRGRAWRWGCDGRLRGGEGAKEAGTTSWGLNGMSGELGGAVQRSLSLHDVDRALEPHGLSSITT